MTQALYAIAGLLILVLWLQVRTYRQVSPRQKFLPGDIVMYVNPGENDPRNNMITEVLEDHGDYASIRTRTRDNSLMGSTTGGASKKFLTRLPVYKGRPITIPTEPVPSGCCFGGDMDTNGARWAEFPLEWFPYTIPLSVWKRQDVA